MLNIYPYIIILMRERSALLQFLIHISVNEAAVWCNLAKTLFFSVIVYPAFLLFVEQIEDIQKFNFFVVLPIVLLIGAVPITPNGLGLQEGAYFFFLQQLGATPDQAVAISLALRAKAYLLAVIGAGIWFGLKKESH